MLRGGSWTQWLGGPAVSIALIAGSGCSEAARRASACDGLDAQTLGITREAYAPCAGEILGALDSLEVPLARFVQNGDDEAREHSESHFRRLRHLMRQVGFMADVGREARGGTGRTVERWPDSNTRIFNNHVGAASAYYMAVLRYPDAGSLAQARREHTRAREAYARFR